MKSASAERDSFLPTTTKLSHNIPAMFRRIRHFIKPFKKAALFELAEMGHDSVFEQLVACIISIRTFDEQTIPCSLRLFQLGRKPEAVAKLSVGEIDAAIRPSTFHWPKAQTIKDIAERAVNEFRGQLPCDEDVLLSFKGVGPKCAHLALGIACKAKYVSVDIHVHRVTNRWGYVNAPTPERTMAALMQKLPKRYWIEINRLLVPFGKHICTGIRPKCSTCPVLEYCRQVGVTTYR